MWAAVVPVTIEEDVSVFGAFSRSQGLTRGARWKIFGIFLLILLIGMLIGVIGILLSTIVLGASYLSPAVAMTTMAIILNLVITTLASAFGSSVLTSLFVELREWKDGPEDRKLSEIFE